MPYLSASCEHDEHAECPHTWIPGVPIERLCACSCHDAQRGTPLELLADVELRPVPPGRLDRFIADGYTGRRV